MPQDEWPTFDGPCECPTCLAYNAGYKAGLEDGRKQAIDEVAGA
jgi:hypothetical protein